MNIVLNLLKGSVSQLTKPCLFIDRLPANVKMIHQNLHLTLTEVLQQTFLDVLLCNNYLYHCICYFFLLLIILQSHLVKSKENAIKISRIPFVYVK